MSTGFLVGFSTNIQPGLNDIQPTVAGLSIAVEATPQQIKLRRGSLSSYEVALPSGDPLDRGVYVSCQDQAPG